MFKTILEKKNKIFYFLVKRICFFTIALIIKFLWAFNFESMYTCVSCEDMWLYDVSKNITTDKYILAFGLLTFVGYKVGHGLYKYYKKRKEQQKLKYEEETLSLCDGNLPKYPDLPNNDVLNSLYNDQSRLIPQWPEVKLPELVNLPLPLSIPYKREPFYKILHSETRKFINREDFITNPYNLSNFFKTDFIMLLENQINIKNVLIRFKNFLFNYITPEKIDPKYFTKSVYKNYSEYCHFINRSIYKDCPAYFKVFNPNMTLAYFGVLLDEPLKQVMRIITYVYFIDLETLNEMRINFFNKLVTNSKFSFFKISADKYCNLNYANDYFHMLKELKSRIVNKFLQNIDTYIIYEDSNILEEAGLFLVKCIHNCFDMYLDILNINIYDLNVLLKYIDRIYSFLYNIFDPTKDPKIWIDFKLSNFLKNIRRLFRND